MEIVIEIGNVSEQELIRMELQVFCEFIEANGLTDQVTKILIPSDFDSAIRTITQDQSYCSARPDVGHYATAKVLPQENGSIIVFSPYLYCSKAYDTLVRATYFFHELSHIYLSKLISHTSNHSQAETKLVSIQKDLFEEYFANRKSIELSKQYFKKTTKEFKNHISSGCNSFLEKILKGSNYGEIQEIILKFKFHFIKFDDAHSEYFKYFFPFSLDLLYFFSYIDSNRNLQSYFQKFCSSKYASSEFFNLLNYFRKIYQSKKFIDLEEPKYIKAFVKTMGIELSDISGGYYMEINSIA